MIKELLKKRLAVLAKKILHTFKPEIIGITGSVGKTTTKEAIAAVLGSRFNMRATYKNYNNEIGLPLTIIGVTSPGKSIKGWLAVFSHAKKIITDPEKLYPEMLVLEMGVDHPGDMDYLTSIAKPTRAVLTRLGSAHVEFFSSISELHNEKLKITKALTEDGILIYNYEDEELRRKTVGLPIKTISYGFSSGADVKVESGTINLLTGTDRAGVSFKIEYQGSSVPVFIPGLISRPGILSALAAAAVAYSYDFNSIEISNALKNFRPPAGRMNLLAGISQTTIIDDTYNSSPEAVQESLETIFEIPKNEYNHSWIVLGDMKELGENSQKAHEEIGRLVSEKKFNFLVTVGNEAEDISKSALETMNEKNVWHFQSSVEAADFLSNKISEKDILLVKGSQAARMEKIVKRLMKEPEKANDLLVRQGADWNN
jgi:UDP-N-acetylmuramoyl-tripeptide--D-alanyl-D-alanine ligase